RRSPPATLFFAPREQALAKILAVPGAALASSPIRDGGVRVFFMGSPALHEERHFTYRDYLSWPDEERCELIDGVVYAMSPAPLLNHQSLVGELYHQLRGQLEGKPC